MPICPPPIPTPAPDPATLGGCDPIASTGICLADGTPIAIVLSRNCDTNVVVEAGWINLLTGVFTAGNPPAGSKTCGDQLDFELSGWLCDVQPDGSVAGIALVQIEHDAETGAVTSITLIGVNGLVYVPTGIMARCASDSIVGVTLCDTGSLPPAQFLRLYSYQAGGSVPFRDVDLAGAAYVPTGPVEAHCPCTDDTVRPRFERLLGIDGFALPANALSLTVIVRTLGAVGSVTVATSDGVLPLRDAEVMSWSVVRDQDSLLVGPWSVATTNAADEVVVLWTEAV